MSEKMAKRVRRLESRINLAEATLDSHDKRLDNAAKWSAAMQEAVADLSANDTERSFRRRAREAERAVVAWRRMTYAVLVSSIIVLVAAILVVNAEADDAKNTPDFAMNPIKTEVHDEITEDFENENIEASLLDRSRVIEDCTITFYCNEKYPHICGTGDGIAADGTPALAWSTCAVDPDVIPLGSTVMVDLGDGDGLRTLVANDTGVNGNHLDICVGSHQEALQLGRQTAAVYWCEE